MCYSEIQHPVSISSPGLQQDTRACGRSFGARGGAAHEGWGSNLSKPWTNQHCCREQPAEPSMNCRTMTAHGRAFLTPQDTLVPSTASETEQAPPTQLPTFPGEKGQTAPSLPSKGQIIFSVSVSTVCEVKKATKATHRVPAPVI